jgi:hypothetical protein
VKKLRKNSMRVSRERACARGPGQAVRLTEKNLELAALTRERPRPFSW